MTLGIKPAYTDDERAQLLEVVEQLVDDWHPTYGAGGLEDEARADAVLDRVHHRLKPVVDVARRRALKAVS